MSGERDLEFIHHATTLAITGFAPFLVNEVNEIIYKFIFDS